MEKFRIGQGWDLHRLGPGTSLRLGGLDIPFQRSAIAHSDGDALCHAVIDALLGAAHLGDIGRLFPDTDEAYRDANSMELLAMAWEKVAAQGWEICNLDCTLILQRPKLAPLIPGMEENLARVLGIPAEDVSIKAKTAEGLGPNGAGESMEAWATVLLKKDL